MQRFQLHLSIHCILCSIEHIGKQPFLYKQQESRKTREKKCKRSFSLSVSLPCFVIAIFFFFSMYYSMLVVSLCFWSFVYFPSIFTRYSGQKQPFSYSLLKLCSTVKFLSYFAILPIFFSFPLIYFRSFSEVRFIFSLNCKCRNREREKRNRVIFHWLHFSF